MRDGQISSLVVQGRPPGLVTASDLHDRVLAVGRSSDTPVEAGDDRPAADHAG
jgi:hypothetical protein